ncbi:Hypothetical protein CINCED_3A021721 [Cinara cedri]|uniref:Uncharacterized protein n=1 Tax=Cinara cedri TaxID=506608 RepID=A0A5E4LYF9_9HEMI|nr:Hypothetical protein CINCED_3A021721 [Cinara cedri]
MNISWTFFVLIIFNLNEIISSKDDQDTKMEIKITTHGQIEKNRKIDVHVISTLDGSDVSSSSNKTQEKDAQESENSEVRIKSRNDMTGSVQFQKKTAEEEDIQTNNLMNRRPPVEEQPNAADLVNNPVPKSILKENTDVPTGEEKNDDTNPQIYNLSSEDEKSIPKSLPTNNDANPQNYNLPSEDEKSIPKSLPRRGYSVTYSGVPKSDEDIASFTGDGTSPPVYDWGSNDENSKLESPPRRGYSVTYSGVPKSDEDIASFTGDGTSPPVYDWGSKDENSKLESPPRRGYSVTYSGVPKSDEDIASFTGDGTSPPVYDWGSNDENNKLESPPRMDK